MFHVVTTINYHNMRYKYHSVNDMLGEQGL